MNMERQMDAYVEKLLKSTAVVKLEDKWQLHMYDEALV